MTASSPSGSTLYFTRWTPAAGGPYPVRVHEPDEGPRRIDLVRGGETESFTTTKGFLTTLHGPSYARRHWTIDRYLSRGKHDSRPDALAGPGLTVVGRIGLSTKDASIVWQGSDLTRALKAPPEPLVGITVLVRSRRGIDLEARGHEVAKLLYAGFHNWIRSAGYDFEDVLQEVYRKILVANQGRAPWDPEKSSFGHYVHMVCGSALSNYHRKHNRVRLHETPGVPGLCPDGQWGQIDVRDSNRQEDPWKGGPSKPTVDPVQDLQKHIATGPYRAHPDAGLAMRIVPLVQEGHTLKDIAMYLGEDRSSVSQAMKLLRLCAAGWAH